MVMELGLVDQTCLWTHFHLQTDILRPLVAANNMAYLDLAGQWYLFVKESHCSCPDLIWATQGLL